MYLNGWETNGFDGMVEDFHATAEDVEGIEVLLASYEASGYEGDAFVLFQRDGALYEVHGSHCSCNGLEYQWRPEETTVHALRHLLDKGNLGQGEHSFAAELRRVLDALDETGNA